jgi:NAD(P)-dependent dehydrogenase (short-subunit alcohol dehydrogenase family)
MSDLFGLSGRTVLVTGGTRGIGAVIARQLAQAGATVVANYARNDAAAEAFAADATAQGLAIELLRADLTTPKGMAAVLERMQQAAGTTLSVVHCAATGVHRPIEQLSLRHWDWTMALNVRAFFELVQGLHALWSDGSAIVVLSSAGAVRAVPAYAAVGSSKGALEALARHLAAELAPRGVRVNILSPGSVATAAWDAFPDKEKRLAQALERTPLGRLVSLEEVASVAQFLCSPASRGIVGHTLVVDGGTRVLD